jgi:hypothetical protein
MQQLIAAKTEVMTKIDRQGGTEEDSVFVCRPRGGGGEGEREREKERGREMQEMHKGKVEKTSR